MVGFVVPVLANNLLAYRCLCPVSLHLVAKTGLRVSEVALLGCRKRLTRSRELEDVLLQWESLQCQTVA